MPNIPNVTPDISLTRCEAINLLLSSVALEEIGLSHILNAEGEKLQLMLKKCCTLDDYRLVNESIHSTLRTIVKSQMILQFKLEDIMLLDKEQPCDHECKKKQQCCDDFEKHCSCKCEHADPESRADCPHCFRTHHC